VKQSRAELRYVESVVFNWLYICFSDWAEWK